MSSTHLGPYDVICGRHKLAFNNVGNRRFRIMIALALDRYMSAPSRYDKTQVVISMVDLVHQVGGRFLRWSSSSSNTSEPAGWKELSHKLARDKVGHAFRDMSSTKVLSNNTSKDTNHSLLTSQPKGTVTYACPAKTVSVDQIITSNSTNENMTNPGDAKATAPGSVDHMFTAEDVPSMMFSLDKTADLNKSSSHQALDNLLQEDDHLDDLEILSFLAQSEIIFDGLDQDMVHLDSNDLPDLSSDDDEVGYLDWIEGADGSNHPHEVTTLWMDDTFGAAA